jgi:hypothetical protein
MPVYLVQAGENGPVKIGFSNSVQSRLRKIQTDIAEKLILLRLLDGGRELEASLHARFAAQRLRGEWFQFSKEMLWHLGATELILKKPTKNVNVRQKWSPESRVRAADRQLELNADPVRKAEKMAKMQATALRKITIGKFLDVVNRAGGWRKLSAAIGVSPEELMSWQTIPVRYLEAVAAAARLPVMKLTALASAA